MKIQSILLLSVALCGCATQRGAVVDISFLKHPIFDTNGLPVSAGSLYTKKTSKASSQNLFESKSTIDKASVGQTLKSQRIGVIGLDQSASSTNAVEALKAIDSILGKVAK